MENSGPHGVTLILLLNHQARQHQIPQLLGFNHVATGISQLLQPKMLPNHNGFWTQPGSKQRTLL